jgi:hypothetical protein
MRIIHVEDDVNINKTKGNNDIRQMKGEKGQGRKQLK